MANASSYRRDLRGKRPSPGPFTSPPAQGCPRFTPIRRAPRRIAGEIQTHSGTVDVPRIAFYSCRLTEPDSLEVPSLPCRKQNRYFASHLPERFSRTGTGTVLLLSASGPFCFRPGRTFRVFPGPPGFQANSPFHLFRPDNGHPLVATKTDLRFFYPLHERHAP